jgi:hypothetical protein
MLICGIVTLASDLSYIAQMTSLLTQSICNNNLDCGINF